jgi:hypothetical protein
MSAVASATKGHAAPAASACARGRTSTAIERWRCELGDDPGSVGRQPALTLRGREDLLDDVSTSFTPVGGTFIPSVRGGTMKALTRCLLCSTVVAACAAAILPNLAVAAGTNSYYLDCGSGNDRASGTSSTHAWRSLERASSHTFRPGDRLLIRRGTYCQGTLAPRGSGTPASPILVDAYGFGAKPELDGTGARAAVYLYNVEGWELRHISVTNRGNSDQRTNGIWVVLEDYGVGAHYVVADVNVHDVTGCTCDEPDPTGGIVFSVIGSAIPSGFDGIAIRRNTVSRADGSAIGTSSIWSRRPEYPGGPGTTYVPITDLLISNNRITDAGADGISVRNAVGPVVQHNLIDGFAHHSADYRSGIFIKNSDNTLAEYNEVTDGTGNPQGVSYDIDHSNVGTTLQYNLSHDNEGLSFLICNNAEDTSRDSVIRYNISENDHTPFSFYGVIVGGCAPVENTHFYNNTIYSPEAHTIVRNLGGGGEITFTNNIFVGQPDTGSAVDGDLDRFDHNLYYRVSTLPPDTGAVVGDPLFVAPGSATSLADADGYHLRTGSPALRAGVPVAGAPKRDYFGNLVGARPHIGAFQGDPR